MKNKKENSIKDKTAVIEERTIEELLEELRNKKNWSYIDVIEELSKLGVIVDIKTIKKWELGLEYPDTNILYKFSELYFFPAENFIMAKSNSYTKGYNSIHRTFIKWICYFTGVSFKVGYVISITAIFIALILAFMFFISKCDEFLQMRGH